MADYPSTPFFYIVRETPIYNRRVAVFDTPYEQSYPIWPDELWEFELKYYVGQQSDLNIVIDFLKAKQFGVQKFTFQHNITDVIYTMKIKDYSSIERVEGSEHIYTMTVTLMEFI